jgi:hypothetical protein
LILESRFVGGNKNPPHAPPFPTGLNIDKIGLEVGAFKELKESLGLQDARWRGDTRSHKPCSMCCSLKRRRMIRRHECAS